MRQQPSRLAWIVSGALLACAGQEQGAEPMGLTPQQIWQPVLTEGAVFGDALPMKTVVLTYDDGPDEHTLALAQYLNDNDIRATFFINGSRICKTLAEDGTTCLVPPDTRPCDNGLSQAPVANPIYYPESLLHQVVSLGHRLANHTVDHCHLPAQDNPDNFVFELKGTQDIIDRHICDGLYLFRAPYGEWDAQAAALAQADPVLDKLIGPIQWDIDGLDWNCYQLGTSIEACGDGYLDILRGRAQQNGIFLLHDRPEFNVGADGPLLLAQYMVPILKAEGYQFATLEDLIDFTPQGDFACPFDDGSGGASGGGAGGMGGMGGSGGLGGAGAGGASAGAAGEAAAGIGGAPEMIPAGGGGAGGAGGEAGMSAEGGAAVAVVGGAGGTSQVPIGVAEPEQEAACTVAPAALRVKASWGPQMLVAAALGVIGARRRRSNLSVRARSAAP